MPPPSVPLNEFNSSSAWNYARWTCALSSRIALELLRWRRRADSNRWIRVLQTLALPLGYVARRPGLRSARFERRVRRRRAELTTAGPMERPLARFTGRCADGATIGPMYRPSRRFSR